jgi:hypothetical protein
MIHVALVDRAGYGAEFHANWIDIGGQRMVGLRSLVMAACSNRGIPRWASTRGDDVLFARVRRDSFELLGLFDHSVFGIARHY